MFSPNSSNCFQIRPNSLGVVGVNMACFSWKCPPEKTKLPNSNRLILPGFHNADRLNDTCFQCIYSFNTLFGLLLQFHPAPVRGAGLQILTVFLLSRHRNCLHFTLTLINVAINKNKCCQEKSGTNQFSLDAHLTLPTPLRSLLFGRPMGFAPQQQHTRQLWAIQVWRRRRS